MWALQPGQLVEVAASLTSCLRLHSKHETTRLRCRLETGRTHQIRVHLHSIGHPLIGDPVYGISQRKSALPVAALEFPRQALHAARLALIHPVTGEELCWESALPADMSELVGKLKNAQPP